MLIETEINIDDYKAYLKLVKKTNLKTTPVLFLIYVLIGTIFISISWTVDLQMHLPTAFVVILLMVIIANAYLLIAQKKLYPERDGLILGRHTLKVDDDGIHVAKEHYESFAKWSGVKSVKETDKHYFIMLDRIAAHIIPKRSFSDEAQMREFKDLMNNR
jgi:hypothetical protein